MKLQRYSPLYQPADMTPDDDGEWVKWEDVEKVIVETVASLQQAQADVSMIRQIAEVWYERSR